MSKWGERQTGVGPFAWMIGRRFEVADGPARLNRGRRKLRTDLFTAPREGYGPARAVLTR